MTAPRRMTAALIALATASLSGGVQLPTRGDPAAPDAPSSYAASASSEATDVAIRFLAEHETGLSPDEERGLAAEIVAASKRVDLPIALVLAVIQVESAGDNFAVSPVGAMGLMQLMPTTAEAVARRIGASWTGPTSLFDPILNVRLGTTYLRELVDRYESVDTALAAYNWGPTRIAERMRDGEPIPAIYARKVLSAYDAARSGLLQI